jgi:hypothetical protein
MWHRKQDREQDRSRRRRLEAACLVAGVTSTQVQMKADGESASHREELLMERAWTS